MLCAVLFANDKRVINERSKMIRMKKNTTFVLHDENDTSKRKDGTKRQTPEIHIVRGLLAASKQPASLSDIRSFKNLHSPRVHRMAEWHLQYECACRRQEQYLQQIKELRQQFQRQDNDRVRVVNGTSYFWDPPLTPLTKLNKSTSMTCVLQPQKKYKAFKVPRGICDEQYPSENDVGDLAVVSDSINAMNEASQSNKLPPIGGFDRNKTDYEPIEHIAKRNKLNLGRYFEEGETLERTTYKEEASMLDWSGPIKVHVQSSKTL